MKIVLHYPTSAEGIRQLQTTVAECHAKIITAHIDALPVSKEKKKVLLDMVIENIASQKND